MLVGNLMNILVSSEKRFCINMYQFINYQRYLFILNYVLH